MFGWLRNIAKIWQPMYSRINDWDLPWLRDLCRKLWNVLGDDLKKSLFNLVTGLAKRYGEDTAKGFMEKIKEEFDKTTLIYTGDEPDCWACRLPIHKTHFSRRLNGNYIHRSCFRKIKKIALGGGGIGEF